MLKGIDVSRWQGVIDWNTAKSSIQFAVIKAAGSDNGLYPDGQFARNRNEVRRLDIPHMFYYYLGGVFSPEVEADHFLSVVGTLVSGEGLVLDWEEHHPNEVDYLTRVAKRVKDRVGFPPLIYMSLSRVRGQNWQPLVALNCGLWVAAWGNNDAIPDAKPGSGQWPFWALWQYSSTTSVPGIAGRVDGDLFAADDTATFKKYGLKGATGPTPPPTPTPQPTPPPTPTPTPQPPTTGEYTVQSGDTLSKIGAKYGVSWQAIFAMNTDRIADPNRIFPGQKLRVPGAAPAPAPSATYYVVVSGDNLSSIAVRYGTTWQQVYAWNRDVIGPNPNFIKPGQRLRVR